MTVTPTIRTYTQLLLFTSLLAACGGQALDVGSNDGSGASDNGSSASDNGSGSTGAGAAAGYCNVEGLPDAGPALQTWPDAAACGAGSSPLQGTWTGYVQGEQQYPGYPDNGNFTVDLSGDDGALCGTVTFGPPVSYPPATDPDRLPPGFDMHNPSVMPGFSYRVLGALISDQRLQFQISLSEPFHSWCEIQTSYWNGDNYHCSRNLDGIPDQGNGDSCRQFDVCWNEEVIVSCQHMLACMIASPCECNRDGCGAKIDSPTKIFDLRVDGDSAQGVLDSNMVFLERN